MEEWEEVVKFHGHSCMGLATGYRVAEAALKELGSDRDIDEEIVAIVENDSCAVDAVQYLTGCTFGKGNLLFKDHGKPVYTFGRRSDGKAIRIVVRSIDENRHPGLADLRAKVMDKIASEEEKQLYEKKLKEAIHKYLEEPLDRIVEIEEIKRKLPEKARIFNSLTCEECGEKVMEARTRIKNRKTVCIPCAGTE